MRVRRAWCPICAIRYTILPIFVAPAKWYSYTEIERALLFISWSEFQSITSGLKAWEIERQHRIENAASAGPCASTVRLWWKTLGPVRSDGQWIAHEELEQALTTNSKALKVWPLKRSETRALTIMPEEPWTEDLALPAIQAPELTLEQNSSPSQRVLQKLRLLGKILLVQWPAALAVSLLAIGAWFLDGKIEKRCLASQNLDGRVIPCRSPSLEVSDAHPGMYPPHTYPPP